MDEFKTSNDGQIQASNAGEVVPEYVVFGRGEQHDAALAAARSRFNLLIGELKRRLNTWGKVAATLGVDRTSVNRWRTGNGVGNYAALNKRLEQVLKSVATPPAPIQGTDQTLHMEESDPVVIQNIGQLLGVAHELRHNGLHSQATVMFKHVRSLVCELERVYPVGSLEAAKLRACEAAAQSGLRRFCLAYKCYGQASDMMRAMRNAHAVYRYSNLSQTFLAAKASWVIHKRHSILHPEHKMRNVLTDCYEVASVAPPDGAKVTTKRQRYGLLLTLAAMLNDKKEFLRWCGAMVDDADVYGDSSAARKAIRESLAANEDGEFDNAISSGWLDRLKNL